MTIKSRLLVVASAAFLATSALSLPVLAAATSTGTPAVTKKQATQVLPKALVGKAKSFKLETGNALTVEDQAGAWYKIDLNHACKPLAKAKGIRIAKSRLKGHIGSVVVGKRYCTIKSFAKAPASGGK